MKKEIYYCDICKKEVHKNELSEITFPVEHLNDSGVNMISDKFDHVTLDMCPRCQKNLVKAIKDGFCTVRTLDYTSAVELSDFKFSMEDK